MFEFFYKRYVFLKGDTEWDAPEVEGNAIGGVGVRGALAAPDISEGQLIIPRRTTIRETDDEVASALMMHDYSMTEGDQLNIHVNITTRI